MNILISSILLPLIISVVLVSLCYLINKKLSIDREKSSSFECGFDAMCSSRIPFSINFFLISIIFLIFDIEIALILPILISKNIFNSWFQFLTLILFLFILLWGLYHEWFYNSLDWVQ